MAPKVIGVAGFAFVLVSGIVLFSGWGVEVVEGVVWITEDAKGRKAVFEVPNDHPALRATGKDSEMWTKTELFLEFERRLAKMHGRRSGLGKTWQVVHRAGAGDEKTTTTVEGEEKPTTTGKGEEKPTTTVKGEDTNVTSP